MGVAGLYMWCMLVIAGLALFLITVFGMELFAYVMHRWVMHGPGWFLHADHHGPHKGFWERNDLYFVIFAVPSATMIILGTSGTTGHWATIIGAGVAAYGAIYVGFHDIIVHKRLNHRYIPKSTYMKRIIQAHRLHHVVETREGTVSFGFLWAPKPEALKAELARRGRAGVRAPVVIEADRVA